MNGIYKFEREMLEGESIHVNKRTKDTSYKKHWHNYYEIIFYYNCQGICTLNGLNYVITKSCLFLLTPKDFHEIMSEKTDESSSIIISFTEQAVDKGVLESLTMNPVVLYDLPPDLQGKAQELYSIFRSKGKFREVHLKSLLNCILIEILEAGRPLTQSDTEMNPAIRHAISYVLTHPTEDISLSRMSETVDLSAAYFSHLFKVSTGISFKKYVNMIRVEYAKRLLEEKELSVLEVGFESGFNTPSQFIRVFKDQVGTVPSKYKKENRT